MKLSPSIKPFAVRLTASGLVESTITEFSMIQVILPKFVFQAVFVVIRITGDILVKLPNSLPIPQGRSRTQKCQKVN